MKCGPHLEAVDRAGQVDVGVKAIERLDRRDQSQGFLARSRQHDFIALTGKDEADDLAENVVIFHDEEGWARS
jgi:hypothetical protein